MLGECSTTQATSLGLKVFFERNKLSKELMSRNPMQKADDANITVPQTHKCVPFAYYRNCQWKQDSLDKDRSLTLEPSLLSESIIFKPNTHCSQMPRH